MQASVKDHPKVVERLQGTVASVDGVRGVRHCRARQSGPYVFVDTVIAVDPRATISAADDVSRRARALIPPPPIN